MAEVYNFTHKCVIILQYGIIPHVLKVPPLLPVLLLFHFRPMVPVNNTVNTNPMRQMWTPFRHFAAVSTSCSPLGRTLLLFGIEFHGVDG